MSLEGLGGYGRRDRRHGTAVRLMDHSHACTRRTRRLLVAKGHPTWGGIHIRVPLTRPGEVVHDSPSTRQAGHRFAHSPMANDSGQRTGRGPAKLRTSCDACGAAKLRCDRGQPACGRCLVYGAACVYGLSRKMGKPPRQKLRQASVRAEAGADGPNASNRESWHPAPPRPHVMSRVLTDRG
jgi:hypothetical protein